MSLDKTKLPNLVHLDPAIMSRVALIDPDNAHGAVYMWGTVGIGYNKDKVALALPNVPLICWRVVFYPATASKLAKCGIQILDSSAEVVLLMLRYLGKDANSRSPRAITRFWQKFKTGQ